MKTRNYVIKNDDFHEIFDFELYKNKNSILIQIFCGQKYKKIKKLNKFLYKNLPNATIIGASTDGEICENKVSTKQIIVSITIFEKTNLKLAYENSDNSYLNGKNLAKKLITSKTKLLILFTDALHTNAENFLKGVESINNKVKICGGMAADNSKFKKTFICANKKILKKGAVGVALNSEELKVFTDFRFDWSEIGIEHTINKVKANRVYEISNMKAVDFYKKYLGEEVALQLPQTGIEFPLIIKNKNLKKARAVVKKHDDGSLSFAGNLKENASVKLGFGNAELIMQSSKKQFEKIEKNINVESFFLYSCMARRRYMPSLIENEIAPFAKRANTCGFFTYAEFFHNNCKNELLNQSLTIVALSETSNKNSNRKVEYEKSTSSDYGRTIKALTHLIEQSSKDYDFQNKKLNKKKEYINKLLIAQKKFLRYTVHETNTPLSVIMSNIELYEILHGENKHVKNIEVAMKNIFSIYDDLSYLIRKDQIEYKKSNINLVDFIRSRIDFFSQLAIQSNSKFVFYSTMSNMPIFFSEAKLQRVVDNNLTNAIKYTLENCDINIELSKKENSFIFAIYTKSNIIQEPNKIFEEYYREEKTQDGFGLGLNLVKRICDEEEVSINVQSNKKFTSFTYEFKGIEIENTAT